VSNEQPPTQGEAVGGDTPITSDSGYGDPHDRDRLRHAAFAGARSFAVTRLVVELTLFSSVIALARLVVPAEMGHAAVALVFPALAVILTFEGFGAALVQRTSNTRAHLRTAMTLSLLTGLLLAMVVAGGAATIGRTILGAKTATLIEIVSPVFIIASTSCVSRAIMMRDLRFKLMSWNEAFTQIGGSLVAVILAAAGLQARAVIYGALAQACLEASLLIRSAPPSAPGFSRNAARDVVGYGSAAAVNGLVWTLRRNVDYLILAARVPAQEVGFYYRAFQFGGEYQGKISSVMLKMLFPLLSRAESIEDMRVVRERSVSFNALTALPLLGLLIPLAPEVVPLLYGPNWGGAIVPTQILAVAGMALALLSGAESPALALGRPRRVLCFQLVFLAIYATAITIASTHGLVAVCITASVIHVVMVLVAQRVLVDSVIGLPMRQIFIDVGPAAVGTVATIAVALLVREAVVGSVAPIFVILICSVAGGLAYVLTLRLLFPGTWRMLLSVLRRIIVRRAVLA
jgi:O-antigen/teichoic acid export membrane protein